MYQHVGHSHSNMKIMTTISWKSVKRVLCGVPIRLTQHPQQSQSHLESDYKISDYQRESSFSLQVSLTRSFMWTCTFAYPHNQILVIDVCNLTQNYLFCSDLFQPKFETSNSSLITYCVQSTYRTLA